ncbi:MAG TPA: hypothetical protein VHU80_12020, partial [Polyangiaceae bacterium]|nr:hypothetical protein [Polyangiaceae bacterium]
MTVADDRTEREPASSRLQRAARDEVREVRPKLLAMNAALAMLPSFALCRVRSRVLRLAGFRIGHGSAFFGAPKINGEGDLYARLTVGRDCAINIGLILDLGAEVIIGDHVSI